MEFSLWIATENLAESIDDVCNVQVSMESGDHCAHRMQATETMSRAGRRFSQSSRTISMTSCISPPKAAESFFVASGSLFPVAA